VPRTPVCAVRSRSSAGNDLGRQPFLRQGCACRKLSAAPTRMWDASACRRWTSSLSYHPTHLYVGPRSAPRSRDAAGVERRGDPALRGRSPL
jgi:hypothetical protein